MIKNAMVAKSVFEPIGLNLRKWELVRLNYISLLLWLLHYLLYTAAILIIQVLLTLSNNYNTSSNLDNVSIDVIMYVYM